MFSKALKIVGLIGGGILALGTGAVGSHLAQPHLEPLLNPERKNREDQLQESFKDAEDQVDALTKNLSELNNQGELQKTSIIGLEGEVETLNDQIKTKTQELSEKEQQLTKKDSEIQAQESLNRSQSEQITNLNNQLTTKKGELSRETSAKEKVKGELDSINERLALTSEEILTKKAQDQSSLKVNIRKVTWSGFSDGVATFNAVNYENKDKQIKIKAGSITNHEERAKEIRSKGINFQLPASFQTWDKIVSVSRHYINYDFTTTDKNKKHAFVVENKSTSEDINLADYFDQKYLEEAFKVFVAIVFLDMLPLCHDLSSQESNKPYLFSEERKISVEFSNSSYKLWDVFSSEDKEVRKFKSHLYSFFEIEDFINYWTQKTVEFVRTGTVDFFDFLNPIVKSQNYR